MASFLQVEEFQSTHPARGATACWRGERRYRLISIHAPREGCDEPPLSLFGMTTNFNPRTPRGVRRYPTSPRRISCTISIHAPREGCDSTNATFAQFQMIFQSTHPARGATRSGFFGLNTEQFQSTHPARGATTASATTDGTLGNFNPRTPRGVRRGQSGSLHTCRKISIHAPREGCDYIRAFLRSRQSDFNPRTPRGVRQ